MRYTANNPSLRKATPVFLSSIQRELSSVMVYPNGLELVDGESVVLEEYAREMIHLEEMHLDEVNKMLRTPGDLAPFQA